MSQPLVVITGASSGIGLATARAFAAVNHPLLLISRNIEPIAELSDKPVDYARVDVTDYDALQRAIRESEQRFGNTD
jgi:NADP-dependent 3-hydroxy acid dehydrogenase YdfG